MAGHGLEQRRAALKSISSSISHRFVIVKARLVLLFVLCAVIMATAMLTWKFSLNATDESFDKMSAQLRQDVTQGAMAELKAVMQGISTVSASLYRALKGMNAGYSRADYLSTVLPLGWSMFSTNGDVDGMLILSSDGFFGGFRRNGPEAPILGTQLSVAIPSPENDTLNLAYGYAPDPVTGQPLLDGPMVKVCAIGSCPEVMHPNEYVPPVLPPLRTPAWLVAQTLAGDSPYVGMSVSATLQPMFSVVRSIKDASGKQKAVLVLAAASTRLQEFLQSTSLVQHFHGSMFITEGRSMNILSASNGTLYNGGGNGPMGSFLARPSLASALNSSDEITRRTARYMETHYGEQLFKRRVDTRARLGSCGVYYINSMPLAFEGLQLLLMLAVPRNEFRGDIDDSRQQGLLFTMAVVIVMFVTGGLAMCISTTGVSRKLSNQEKDLGQAAAANRALMEQLHGLTQVYPEDWPKVDLGTPLEKLTALIKALRPGRVLAAAQVQQMQALVTADDIHKPHFLATMQAGGAEGGGAGLSGVPVDSETGDWIGLLATGRRVMPRDSPSSPRSPGSPGSNNPRWSSRKEVILTFADIERAPSVSRDVAPSPLNRSSLRSLAVLGWDGMPPAVGVSPQCPWQDSAGSLTDTGSARFLRLLCHQTGPMEKHALLLLRSVALAAMPVPELRSSGETADSPGPGPAGPARGASWSASWRMMGRLGSRPMQVGGVDDDDALEVVMRGSESPASSPPLTPLSELRDLVSASDFGKLAGAKGVAFDVASMSEEHRQQVAILSRLGEWDFDTLALDGIALEKTLPLVGYSLFLRTGLIRDFGISEQKLANFLLQVSRGMEAHPYHNAAHVSDVCASFLYLLTHSGLGNHLRGIDKLAALVAALIHDYKHPGVNNDFLSRAREELATIYNDQSPLENYHLAEAFQLIYSNDHCNFLDVLSDEDFTEFRRIVIETVLASDLKRHFGVLDAFKARVSQGTPWDAERDGDRLLLLQMALKAADMGHAAKPLAIHKEWARRANEEFYNQGDAERALSLQVSPFMDRMNNQVPRSQVSFNSWRCPCLSRG
eukprot:jgi/Mesvir1/11936/Mv00270-RA.1